MNMQEPNFSDVLGQLDEIRESIIPSASKKTNQTANDAVN